MSLRKPPASNASRCRNITQVGSPIQLPFAPCKAICLTTTREHAELKADQIHAYGKDDLIAGCKGSMSSTIEPEA